MLRECHVDHPPLTTTRGARDDDEQLGEVEEPQRPTERSLVVDIEVSVWILKFSWGGLVTGRVGVQGVWAALSLRSFTLESLAGEDPGRETMPKARP